MEEVNSISLEQVESLLADGNELLGDAIEILLHIYNAQLFVIGTVTAVLVLLLLYKSIKVLY